MKRLGALILCAALAACSTPTSAPPADLVSPQAMARSGEQLFVASTNSDELRVLNLTVDPNTRVFASAPNPLYVLSVPVVTRPFALASDDDGQGNTGAYVLALSAVSARLGVVVAADQKERAEIALPGTPLSVAARTNGAGATVYVGITLGDGRGAIAKVELPAPADLANGTPSAQIAYDLGQAAPAGLAVSPDGKTLAIGDRLADERAADPAVRRGGLILLELPGGAQTRVFVGGPASRVVYNPAAQQHPDVTDGGCGVEASVPAGKYLYVLVESANCPLGQRCGGVQTLVDGAVPLVAGVPAQPTRIPGAPTDLAVASSSDAGGNLHLGAVACNAGGEPALMLAAPSTNGFVYFLDGQTGQTFNVNTVGPDAGEVDHLDVDGGLIGTDDGTGPLRSTIGVAQGGLESQTVAVVYQGTLPALTDRPATVLSGSDGGSGDTLVDLAADFPALGVQPGDEVSFAGGGAGCPRTATVSGVAPGALTVAASGAIDPSCYPEGGTGTYTVRVGTDAVPYLVAGTIEGYLGRAADSSADGGAVFASEIPYFWRGSGYDPDAGVPALQFAMGTGDRRRDVHWEFTVDNGVSAVSAGGGANAIQPGPVVWAPNLKKFYVGYPGSQVGSHVAEVDPALVIPGTSTNIATFQ